MSQQRLINTLAALRSDMAMLSRAVAGGSDRSDDAIEEFFASVRAIAARSVDRIDGAIADQE